MTNDGHSWADFSTYCSSGSLYSPYCKLHSSTPPKILIERVAVHPIDSAWHAFLVTSTGWCSVTCRSKFAEIYSRRLQHLCWFVGPLLCERDLKKGTSVFFFFCNMFIFIYLLNFNSTKRHKTLHLLHTFLFYRFQKTFSSAQVTIL